MVYIKEQEIKGKTYFYLVENIRLKEGKWKQFKKYLGKSKPSSKELVKIKKVFEEEIKKKTKSRYEYLENFETEYVEKINKQFWKRYRKLNPEEKYDFDRNFLIVFTYNTNSIEGSTLTLKETYKLLEENIAPKKEYNDIVETKAAEKCLNYIREYKGKLNEDFLLGLHKKYFHESKPFIAGKYKRKQNRVINSKFTPTPSELVPTDMRIFFKDYLKNKKKMHVLELSAWVHWKLERIHPFQDGNGRIGRLLMNLILWQNKFAMIDIKTQNATSYYHTLEKCDKQNNAEALARQLAKKFTKQYKNALK